MSNSRFLAGMIFCCLGGAETAVAQRLQPSVDAVVVAGHTLTIPLPAGFCRFDEKRPSELDFAKSQIESAALVNSKIVLLFADCAWLAKTRSGNAPGTVSYGSYSVPLDATKSVVTLASGIKRSDFVASQARLIPRLEFSEIVSRANKAIHKVYGMLADGTTSKQGVVEQTTDAVFLARYSEFKTSDAKSPLVVAGMTAITKVGTVPLILSFSRSITDGKVYEKLLNDSKGTISQLIAQNIALER